MRAAVIGLAYLVGAYFVVHAVVLKSERSGDRYWFGAYDPCT